MPNTPVPSISDPVPPTALTGTETFLPPEVTPAEPHADPEQPALGAASHSPSHSPVDRLLGFLSHTLGLDRAVAFTVLARGWSSLAGILTLTLIARFLTPAEQGYYYTFYSLVALQIVFELGFSVVILQTASHEAAHLVISVTGSISGPEAAHARLASVLQKAVRWYSTAAILMACLLIPVGIYFFSRQEVSHPAAQHPAWLAAWVLVVLATVLTFQVDPLFSFLEGCGYVPQVARSRFHQAILGPLLAWCALLLHHGLLAPGLMILGQAIAGAAFLWTRRDILLSLLRHLPGPYKIAWGTEIWPFQWRIAVSWLCGYLTFQIFSPILFASRGPVEAGQMGMSLSVCGTLSAMAIAWMNTKAAPFGRMIALREFGKLDRVFSRALVQSTAAAVLACVAVWLAAVFLRQRGVPFALRLLPPLPLGLLFGTAVANIVVSGEAMYLRAHKQEKFMVNSIVGALWIAPAFLIGRPYGAYGIALLCFSGSLIVGLGFGTYTFLKWRRIWHAV